MGLVAYLPAANIAVHVTGALVFVYSVYFNYVHVTMPAHVNPIDSAFGGKFKYLTFLDGVSNRRVAQRLQQKFKNRSPTDGRLRVGMAVADRSRSVLYGSCCDVITGVFQWCPTIVCSTLRFY